MRREHFQKASRCLLGAIMGLIATAGLSYGQTVTIGGNIYTGAKDASGNPIYAPNPATPPITNATVMVQNQHSGGAFITYGTVTGNSWTATVPAPGDYVVMFSAPGHDNTSREFTVDAAGNVTNPNGTGAMQDAYLPPLPLPLANLLVYVFYDNIVNGEPDVGDGDEPLNGVTVYVRDEEGNLLATGVTGSQATITTTDNPPVVITDTRGYYYFTGLPPGEVVVTTDPSTVTQAANPHITFDNPNDATRGWYLNYTEEGGPAWDPKLMPGDPGTEAGGFLIWHSYVEKLDQINASNVAKRFPASTTLANAGSISGTLVDADKANLDPAEPFPIPGEDHPGVTLNDRVPDGLVILFTDDETIKPHPVATVEPDPVTGDFTFVNVPPGRYKMMMFDKPLDYIWTQQQVTVAPNQAVTFPLNSLLVPRFFARVRGYVYDNSTNLPMPGLNVHIRYKDGSIQKTETTDANGWYNHDDMPEIEVIGYVDVEMPANYRGTMRTETFYPGGKDPGHPNYTLKPPINVTFNAMNRYVQWLTANYQADLYLEPIPSTEGDIRGFVFNDHLATGTWVGDGVYQKDEERVFEGVTVQLWDATGTTLLQTTTTGAFNKTATLNQGWHEPYTWPPDEIGGVFVGPLPGYYEFRGLAPGSYKVKVIPPAGFSPSPVGSDFVTVTVTGGLGTEQNFGINTLVPLAGEIEGGVFDDVNIDGRGGEFTADPGDATSLLFAEKAGIPGAPVGVYDHLGYRLGAGYMGNPLCFAGAPAGQCPAGEEPVQKPEVERRFAPGVHSYLGNDPTLPGYCPNYLPMALPYEFGQGKYKFEADWSLIPTAVAPFTSGCNVDPLINPNEPVIIVPPAPIGAATKDRHAVTSVVTLTPGQIYRINGHNFGDRQGYSTVTLAGQKLNIKNWTDTYIDVVIPNSAVSGPLVVATSTGISNALPVEINYKPSRASYMSARSVYVDANYTGVSDGSKLRPWKTIEQALSHLPLAKPRYVYVAAGTYYNVHAKIKANNVHLIGAGPHETILSGLPDPAQTASAHPRAQGNFGYGPVIQIGNGKTGSVKSISISGFTITGGTVKDDIGAGIFGDYHNEKIVINTCMIYRNGGYYGGGIWFHRSNHNVSIFSNMIAENGNYGGYGGGISVNDEPDEYEEPHSQPEHVKDDFYAQPLEEGEYKIYNNLIYHNYSPDYGGAITLYEIKDKLFVFGNMIVENKAEDHGGAIFFEECGPVELYGNVFLRNWCYDDGGAVSFEDVGDTLSHVNIYNNLFAENIADDHGENTARGGALAFDDTFYGKVYNNTFVGNIVAGNNHPAGGAIASERNGHEYNHNDPDGSYYVAPGYSDPRIYNNIIWNNWRLEYSQPNEGGEEEDLDYTWGENYVWTPDELHVDNPALNQPWETHNNSESFTYVKYNDIRGGYTSGAGNLNVDPLFVNPTALDWHLQAGSPVISQATASGAPLTDLDNRQRTISHGMVDMGAYEWFNTSLSIVRVPTGILGMVKVPTPGSTSLYSTSAMSAKSFARAKNGVGKLAKPVQSHK
ncbi:MAG: hypothetical protein ONB53_21950 [candidate division KSB1 bacterium]|nr:hypothetical protein [candidate division KSB1 bacterium]MDZ7300434.1 hypothetical protein [candidate division KSB1 bacterium]MDZ7308713.1 hypothetical protein [candidate division KSB1 bacterium]MDZ7351464.1 hypothetical protein [candidate division KSB1 bacterium]MDZ7355823.1 hypothetical protein [candidate division KSB1 bacterium]